MELTISEFIDPKKECFKTACNEAKIKDLRLNKSQKIQKIQPKNSIKSIEGSIKIIKKKPQKTRFKASKSEASQSVIRNLKLN